MVLTNPEFMLDFIARRNNWREKLFLSVKNKEEQQIVRSIITSESIRKTCCNRKDITEALVVCLCCLHKASGGIWLWIKKKKREKHKSHIFCSHIPLPKGEKTFFFPGGDRPLTLIPFCVSNVYCTAIIALDLILFPFVRFDALIYIYTLQFHLHKDYYRLSWQKQSAARNGDARSIPRFHLHFSFWLYKGDALPQQLPLWL